MKLFVGWLTFVTDGEVAHTHTHTHPHVAEEMSCRIFLRTLTLEG